MIETVTTYYLVILRITSEVGPHLTSMTSLTQALLILYDFSKSFQGPFSIKKSSPILHVVWHCANLSSIGEPPCLTIGEVHHPTLAPTLRHSLSLQSEAVVTTCITCLSSSTQRSQLMALVSVSKGIRSVQMRCHNARFGNFLIKLIISNCFG